MFTLERNKETVKRRQDWEWRISMHDYFFGETEKVFTT
jgi:hypothetical protein